MAVDSGIEIYPVGLFKDIKLYRTQKKLKHLGAGRYFWTQFKLHGGKAAYYRGYEAKWHFAPGGVKIWKTGKGWTKRRALKRLAWHVAKSNLVRKGHGLHDGE